MDKYRFREVREEYNERNKDNGIEITQKDMARQCHTTKSTISRIEKGTIEPSLDLIIKYADTFDVSIDFLLRRTNAEKPENRTVSRELGLSDKAIETLKFINQNAAVEDHDIAAFVSAFIGSDSATFYFFDDLFNLMSAEYGFTKYNKEPQDKKARYQFKLEQDMTYRTMEYIKFDVMPQLEKVIKDCYKTENNKLIISNQKE